jgi:fatty-acid desaturase
MPDETMIKMIKKPAKGINWNTTVFMVLFHLGAVAALFLFSWQAVVAAIVLWWVAGSLGIGIEFHHVASANTRRWERKCQSSYFALQGSLRVMKSPSVKTCMSRAPTTSIN